jgi:glutamate formiminotransferase
VLSSEIVGLIPKKALADAAGSLLQLENFDASRDPGKSLGRGAKQTTSAKDT